MTVSAKSCETECIIYKKEQIKACNGLHYISFYLALELHLNLLHIICFITFEDLEYQYSDIQNSP